MPLPSAGSCPPSFSLCCLSLPPPVLSPPAENFPLTPTLFHRRPEPQPGGSSHFPCGRRGERARGQRDVRNGSLRARGRVGGCRLPTHQFRPWTVGAARERTQNQGPMSAPPGVTWRGRREPWHSAAARQPHKPLPQRLDTPLSDPFPGGPQTAAQNALLTVGAPSEPGLGGCLARAPCRRGHPPRWPPLCPAPSGAAAASVEEEDHAYLSNPAPAVTGILKEEANGSAPEPRPRWRPSEAAGKRGVCRLSAACNPPLRRNSPPPSVDGPPAAEPGARL